MKTRYFYLRNNKNERVVCVAVTTENPLPGSFRTAVGVSVWDKKDKYNRSLSRKIAATRAHKVLNGKASNVGWGGFLVSTSLDDDGIVDAIDFGLRKSQLCNSNKNIIPGKLMRGLRRQKNKR